MCVFEFIRGGRGGLLKDQRHPLLQDSGREGGSREDACGLVFQISRRCVISQFHNFTTFFRNAKEVEGEMHLDASYGTIHYIKGDIK